MSHFYILHDVTLEYPVIKNKKQKFKHERFKLISMKNKLTKEIERK